MTRMEHRIWMDRALELAREAGAAGEVPVGAVVVDEGRVIGEAANRRERDQDPTAHAEVVALRAAAAVRKSWRLDGATLYVTLEPCAMCAGALVLARIRELVYGATDPKAGAAGSLYDVPRDPRLNHRLEVVTGVAADEAGALLKRFFDARRARARHAAVPLPES